MTKTPRLSNMQLMLLSSAAARDNGSLIPPPENCTQDRARISKAVSALLRRSRVEELSVTDHRLAWREQDQNVIGLFITDAGRTAISAEPETGLQANAAAPTTDDKKRKDPEADRENHSDYEVLPPATGSQAPCPAATGTAPATVPAEPRTGTKISTVVAMLEREQGATLNEMVEATGWLPHSTRAALTGIRKNGSAITKTKRGDVTCYRIEAEAAA